MFQLPPELVETLAVVIDAGSFDAASRRLHITPSAVSQRIKQLEQIVGRVLVVRARPVRATDAATPLVRYARELALLEQDALATFEQGSSTFSLPLAVNADSLATWFLAPLGRLAARLPVVFDIHRDDQEFTADLLESGAVMGAVTSRSDPVTGCSVSALGAMRYLAVATSEAFERWFADGVTVAALENAPVIDFDRRDDLQARWLMDRGVDPRRPPRHRMPASSEYQAATYMGLGWALLTVEQAADGLEDGSLRLLGGAPMDVPLYWQQWMLRSTLLDDVAREIVAEGQRVLL